MKYLIVVLAIALAIIPVTAQDPKIDRVPTPTPTPASVVRGRVFYADTSRPVRRASLNLIPSDVSGGPSEYSALTDNEGNFEMRGVKAGTYYPMVNAPGVVSPLAFVDFSQLERGDRRSEKEAFAEAFKDFEKIVVNGVNDLDVMIAAKRGGAISGRIAYDDGDAAIGVRVEVLRKVGDSYNGVISNFSALVGMFGGGGQYQTDDRGFFRFSGLPPGEYIVKATENARHTNDRANPGFEALIVGGGSLLTIYNPDVMDPGAAQPVRVEYGQEITEVNVTIPGRFLYKVNGRVISRRDKSPVRAEITLQRVEEVKTFSILNEIGRRSQSSRSDLSGAWAFRELPKGKYRVVVSPQNPVEYEETIDEEGETRRSVKKTPDRPRYAKKIQEIVIEDKDLTEISIELGTGATISGTVEVENRFNEMPELVVVQFNGDEETLTSSTSIYNSRPPSSAPASAPAPMTLPSPAPKADHDFSLEGVTDGKGRLLVIVQNEDYFVKSVTAGSTDLLGGELELKEGEKITNVKIVLGKGTGTVKGTVRNEEKEPVNGAQILFVPVDPKRRTGTFQRLGRSDDLGEYSVRLAPGDYAAVFVTDRELRLTGDTWKSWVEGAMRDAARVKIEGGKTETLDLKK